MSKFLGVENITIKNIDDALSEIDELSERWQNRVTLSNTSFAERYMKGSLWLCVEMTFRESGAEKFIACFHGLPESGGAEVARLPTVSYRHAFEGCNGRNNRSVFVEDVEFIEHPQSMAFPSLVWFYPAHKFFDRSPVATGEFEESFCSVVRQAVQRGSYWEIGFFEGRIGSMPSLNHKAGCEAIKGTPSVMDDVAYKGTPMLGDGLQHIDPINFDSWLRIFIGNDAIRILVLEDSNFGTEISKMLIGSIDL